MTAGRAAAAAATVVVLVLGLVAWAFAGERGPGLPLAGWTTPLGADHPLETDPRLNGTSNGGAPYARRLANQAAYTSTSTPVRGFYGPGYGTIVNENSAPVHSVDRTRQPLRPVVWMTPSGPAPADAANGLQQRFAQVPLPAGPNGERFEDYYHRPMTGGGPDQQLTVYDPSTHELWEMWMFRWDPAAARYEMGYGGYSPDITKGGITFPDQWGARATSIPLQAGMMLQAEYAAGEFDHPLTVSIPVVKPGFIAPATREDANLPTNTVGGDARDAVPEGAWFRLPPDFPIDPNAPELLQMMEKAARDYGIVVADGSGGTVTFYAEGANAIGTPYSTLPAPAFPAATPSGPYYGENNVLNAFPWNALIQVHYQPDRS